MMKCLVAAQVTVKELLQNFSFGLRFALGDLLTLYDPRSNDLYLFRHLEKFTPNICTMNIEHLTTHAKSTIVQLSKF